MKRIFYLLFILPVILASCEETPEAGFFVNNIEPEVGEELFFTNDSYNAETYLWDFGDGLFSEEINPVHEYSVTGTFQVKLTAYSKSGLSDDAFQTITVKIPTLLEIEVLEYYDLYPVADARVILYPTLADWDAESNMVSIGYTDADGKVVFSGLGNFIYYLDIFEAEHDNYDLRQEDPKFIRTPQVKPNQITKFVAYVDYVGGKGGGVRERNVVVKKLVPRRYIE